MGPVSLSIHRPRVSSIHAPTSPPAETARVVINLVMSDTCGCKTQFSSAKWPFGDAALVVPPMALSYYFSRHVFFFFFDSRSLMEWNGKSNDVPVLMKQCGVDGEMAAAASSSTLPPGGSRQLFEEM